MWGPLVAGGWPVGDDMHISGGHYVGTDTDMIF